MNLHKSALERILKNKDKGQVKKFIINSIYEDDQFLSGLLNRFNSYEPYTVDLTQGYGIEQADLIDSYFNYNIEHNLPQLTGSDSFSVLSQEALYFLEHDSHPKYTFALAQHYENYGIDHFLSGSISFMGHDKEGGLLLAVSPEVIVYNDPLGHIDPLTKIDINKTSLIMGKLASTSIVYNSIQSFDKE